MASMGKKWEELFGDSPAILLKRDDGWQQVRVCRRCEAVVSMGAEEPGMNHVRFHDELHRGLHP